MQSYIHRTATAHIQGGEDYPDISGDVSFHQRDGVVWVIAYVAGLPQNESGFFALHIHEGKSCRGNGFPQTGSHYNPDQAPHPMHAGDLPPLLSCDGKAYMAVMTNRFSIDDIMDRTVVIHSKADDFKSQPSGDAGEKIACGIIE